jgi:hypothetical protein
MDRTPNEQHGIIWPNHNPYRGFSHPIGALLGVAGVLNQ